MQIKHRINGLDTLRAIAIILVLMIHYEIFVSQESTFGFFGKIGWAGVDLFFVLSGYLIGNQIFSSIVSQCRFSLKTFYYRRLLRTLPNYLFVLCLYFLIPGFREKDILPPLWKFLTFTQNIDLTVGTAFSHAWSLCIEEQFYLIFPVVTLLIAYTKSWRFAWWIVPGILISGVIVRSILWIYCVQNSGENFVHEYYSKIYYSSCCRLDELVLGVSIAMLRNFQKDTWLKVMEKGNLILLLGMIGSVITLYLFFQYQYNLWMIAIGYPLLGVSFSALTIAALSPTCYLHNMKIPGAASLAIWSYAVYLVHKPMMVITDATLLNLGMPHSSFAVLIVLFVSVFSGWLLYVCVEAPVLKFRDRGSEKGSIPDLIQAVG